MVKDQKKDDVYKIVLIGDKDVGKEILRENYFGYNQDFTAFEDKGLAFAIKRVETEEVKIAFQIWDLGSEEEYDTARPYFYRNAIGAFLVFDVTNPSSFKNLPKWLEELWKRVGKVPMIICGNRVNLREGKESKEIVRAELGREYCRRINEKTGIDVLYVETSEETGENLEEAFLFLVKTIIGKGEKV
ncbi:MAG: GTP-binding protein [Candidatus Heimdallarchaeota archaeon]|nr:GTP-binding protein [Candidatus Heimdallarchaeota archaeon]MBY8994171.1 GTP-binding protein [Candidatus Heimdallarchaeota archaeon]